MAAAHPKSRLDLDPPTVGVDFSDPVDNNLRLRWGSKLKSSRPDRRKGSCSGYCSDDSAAHDSSPESCGSSKKGDDRSSNYSENWDRQLEEGIRYSSSKKTRSNKPGFTSSTSKRDWEAETEDISTHRDPRWEELEELNSTNYLFEKFFSY